MYHLEKSKSNTGFSLESRKRLHTIFEAWGFPDYRFYEQFDDFELFKRSRLKENMSDSLILNEWEEIQSMMD